MNDENAAESMDAIRARVADATGLPVDILTQLVGSTEEELRTSADMVAKLVTPPSLTTRSRPAVGGEPGEAAPSEDDLLSDPVRLAAEIRRRLPY